MTGTGEAATRLDGLTEHAVLTVAEAAALARCGRRAIYGLIQTGRVPAVKVGPWYRIPMRPFVDYLEHGDATLVAGS